MKLSPDIEAAIIGDVAREVGTPPPRIDTSSYVRWPPKKGGNPDAFLRAYVDREPAVIHYGDWASGVSVWKPLSELVALSPDELRQLQEQAKVGAAENAKFRAHSREQMLKEWNAADPDGSNPYIVNKGLLNYRDGIRFIGKELIVPVQIDGKIISYQRILPNGSKLFRKGCPAKGGYFVFGELEGAERILIGEGWATIVATSRATGYPAIAALSKGNLKSVALHIKRRFPKALLVILADDDHKRALAEGRNLGIVYATEAADAADAILAIPKFDRATCPDGTDFWDMATFHGDSSVRNAIEAAIAGEPNDTQMADALEDKTEANNNDDVLHDLVEKTKDDPGAAFEPEVLECLRRLRDDDRGGFETLRSKLRRAGCRVTALDDALGSEKAKKSQSEILIELAQDAELFHDEDGTGYADMMLEGRRETWPLRSKSFRLWLTRAYYEETNGAPGRDAIQAALDVLQAQAHFRGPKRAIHVRVGGANGKIYIDLCNERWQAVEIDADGWRVVDCPPVRFRRASGMLPLPTPENGGHIDALRPFLNVKSDGDFLLAVSWIVAAMRDRGPYPALVLSGEQGTAKSTFTAICRSLFDPNSAMLRALPKDDRDLFISASNSHALAFDNLSGMSAAMSDSLCKIATGAAHSTRQLYSDDEETIFKAMRPIVLNGIEETATRGDLADRAIVLTLEPIAEADRKTEQELFSEFNAAAPKIFGALLGMVAEGLRRLPSVHLATKPRMADFATWATACESAHWPAGAFLRAYNANREDAVEAVLEADPVGSAIRALMQGGLPWEGTATELLKELSETVGEKTTKDKRWPQDGARMGGRVRRIAPALRKVGIDIEAGEREGKGRTRKIRISVSPGVNLLSAQPPSLSAEASYCPPSADCKELKSNGVDFEADRADGADSNFPPITSGKKPAWSERI